MKRGTAQFIVVCAVLGGLVHVAGCGGGGGDTPRGGTVTIPTVTLAGRVTVPAGCPVALSSLRIVNGLGESPVAADGAFGALSYQDSSLLIVQTGDGAPMLMGWTGGSNVVSARSTAEVLAFYGTGCFVLPPAAQVRAQELLGASTDLDALASAISAALVSSPRALVDGSAAVKAALSEAVTRLVPATRALSPRGRGILSEPNGAQSGMRLDLVGDVNTIQLTNTLRRPGYAWVERTGVVQEDGTLVPTPAGTKPVAEFDIPSVAGLNGVVGTFTDIINGTMAYAEKATDPVTLTVEGKESRYRVTVVGPAPGNQPGVLSSISLAKRDKLTALKWRFLAMDILLPAVSNFLLPKVKFDEIDRFLSDSDLLSDYIALMQSLPTVKAKMDEDDMKGAFGEAWLALGNTNWFKKHTLDLLFRAVASSSAGANGQLAAAGMAGQVLNALGAVDLMTSVFDFTVMGVGLLQAEQANTWDLRVTKPKVTLHPAESTLAQYDNVYLTATVVDAGGSGPPPVFTYHWKHTGAGGTIRDGIAGHNSDEYDSSKESVQFIADGDTPGVDTVAVTVYQVKDGGKSLIGTASAKVTVTGSKVSLGPAGITLGPDATQLLTASIAPAPAQGTTVRYDWTCTGEHGSLDGGLNTQTTSAPTITYRAGSNTEGEDTITVKAMQQDGASWTSLGTGSVAVAVEKTAYELRLLPNSATLRNGEGKSFTAELAPPAPSGAELVYTWVYTNTAGSFNGQGTTLETTTNSAIYTARDAAGSGSDTFTVTAYRVVNGTRKRLASAAGTVKVQETRIIFNFDGPGNPIPIATRVKVTAQLDPPMASEEGVSYEWTYSGAGAVAPLSDTNPQAARTRDAAPVTGKTVWVESGTVPMQPGSLNVRVYLGAPGGGRTLLCELGWGTFTWPVQPTLHSPGPLMPLATGSINLTYDGEAIMFKNLAEPSSLIYDVTGSLGNVGRFTDRPALPFSHTSPDNWGSFWLVSNWHGSGTGAITVKLSKLWHGAKVPVFEGVATVSYTTLALQYVTGTPYSWDPDGDPTTPELVWDSKAKVPFQESDLLPGGNWWRRCMHDGQPWGLEKLDSVRIDKTDGTILLSSDHFDDHATSWEWVVVRPSAGVASLGAYMPWLTPWRAPVRPGWVELPVFAGRVADVVRLRQPEPGRGSFERILGVLRAATHRYPTWRHEPYTGPCIASSLQCAVNWLARFGARHRAQYAG